MRRGIKDQCSLNSKNKMYRERLFLPLSLPETLPSNVPLTELHRYGVEKAAAAHLAMSKAAYVIR